MAGRGETANESEALARNMAIKRTRVLPARGDKCRVAPLRVVTRCTNVTSRVDNLAFCRFECANVFFYRIFIKV